MTAQIRPNRMEVSDRFPMLGFNIRADQPDVEAEVALATDIALFKPENRTQRTAANFYTSREAGKLKIPRGEGVFVVPPDALARFIGSDRLFFGLASGHPANGGLAVDAVPRDGSPYVSLRGLTGRTLRRMPGARRTAPVFDWAGDAARPGSEPSRALEPAGAARAGGSGGGARPGSYDDGFGPLEPPPARPAPAAAAPAAPSATPPGTPVAQSLGTLPPVRALSDTPVPADPPSVTVLGTVARIAIESGIALVGGPLGALVLSLKSAANALGCSVGFGPQVGAGLGAGGALGAGIIFGKDGDIGVYGATEIDIGFITSISATGCVTIVKGGIDAFNGWNMALAVSGGEGVVGGGAALFDPQGNFVGVSANVGIGAGFSPVDFYVAAQRGWATRVLALAASAATPSQAMTIGIEDVQRAQAYAPRWQDLHNWTVPGRVSSMMSARGFTIQRIADAHGELNLDRYEVEITTMPGGMSGTALLDHFRKNINGFLDTDNTEFIPYADEDATRIQSADPVGGVWKLDIVGPDNASVVISESTPNHFRVTTINTPETGDHPVSGHREFFFFKVWENIVFYTRGCDRATQGIAEFVVWGGADQLWRSFQTKMVAWVNANGGAATAPARFSERFHPQVVRILYGTAQALTAEPARDTLVRPSMPGDQRARAGRIGGQFGERIGQALDLSLKPETLDPLLDVLDPPVAAQPMSFRPAARSDAMSTNWSINWDGINLIAQPTDLGCWAATLAMMLTWRDGTPVDPAGIAQRCGRDLAVALPWEQRDDVARILGLGAAAPQCYLPEGFASLIENHGPLYVGKIMSDTRRVGHAVLVVGMYSDGNDYFIRVTDPWDRPVGTPGSPGAYGGTHVSGSRYIMRYEDFQREYEMAAAGNPAYVQILYPGVPSGRSINRGTSAPAGFAMEAQQAAPAEGEILMPPPPAPRARAMAGGADAAIAIGGFLLETVRDNSGDVSWELDQFRAIKHPNDTAPASPAAFQDATTIRLNEWPITGSVGDDISAWFSIDWQYNGKSLGNVRITNIGTNDAYGWGLNVRAQIMDDNRLYPPNQCAALRLTFHYRFSAIVGSDRIAITEVHLYGDGTWESSSRWVQNDFF